MNHTNRCCIFFGGLFCKSGHMSDDWSHIRWAIQLYLTNTILICCYNLLDTWTKAKFPIKYVRKQSNSLSNKYFAPNQSLRDKYKNYCNSSITERLIAPECESLSLMIVAYFGCNDSLYIFATPGSKPLNFVVLLVFLILKHVKRSAFQIGVLQSDNWFFGRKISRNRPVNI